MRGGLQGAGQSCHRLPASGSFHTEPTPTIVTAFGLANYGIKVTQPYKQKPGKSRAPSDTSGDVEFNLSCRDPVSPPSCHGLNSFVETTSDAPGIHSQPSAIGSTAAGHDHRDRWDLRAQSTARLIIATLTLTFD